MNLAFLLPIRTICAVTTVQRPKWDRRKNVRPYCSNCGRHLDLAHKVRINLNPMGHIMKHFLAPILAATIALSSATAFAGGPVIIDDETEVVPAKPTSSVGILPIILVTVALCAALCGGNDDDPQEENPL